MSKRNPFLLFLSLALLTPAAFAPYSARAQNPVVDRSTPHPQDGLSLVAITRGDSRGMYQFPVPAGFSFLSAPSTFSQPGQLAVWIKSAKPIPPPKPGQPFSMGMPGGSIVNTDVQLQAQMIGGYAPNGPQTPLYVLFVPGGYGPQTHALEFSFSDGRGHLAMWKIDNLPPSYHAVPPSVPLKSAFARPGVMFQAIAWHDSGIRGRVSMSPQSVGYRIMATTGAGPAWAVRVKRTLLEWEGAPPRPAALNRFGGFYGGPPLFFGSNAGRRGPGSYVAAQGSQLTPYGNEDHRLRLDCDLVRLATASETVTFRNLNVRPYSQPTPPQFRGRGPRTHYYAPPESNMVAVAHPQTLTTPSGVSVTLLPVSTLPPGAGVGGGSPNSAVSLLLRFNGPAPGMIPVSLPRSPLTRAYHKMLTFAITAASPLALQNSFLLLESVGSDFGRTNPPGEFVVTLISERHPFGYMTLPKFLPSLTLTITQTAQLQSQPVSFVVPIQNAPPQMPGMSSLPRAVRR